MLTPLIASTMLSGSGMHRRHHQRCSFVIYRDILKALTGSYLRAQLVLLLRYIAIYRGPVLTMENPVRCTGTNNRNRLSNHLRIKFLRSCYLLEFKPADMSSSMLKDVFLMVHITCRVRSKATKQQMLAFGHRTPNTQSKFAHLAHLICGLRAFVT